ncbi:hypothetical protein AB1N83_013337 [Pleurotus pulmonarius]
MLTYDLLFFSYFPVRDGPTNITCVYPKRLPGPLRIPDIPSLEAAFLVTFALHSGPGGPDAYSRHKASACIKAR